GGRIDKGVVANSLSHTYDIKVNMDNPTHTVLPGMVCKVKIALGGNASGACTVPVNAVQKYYDGRYFVWCVNNGRAQRQMVKLGTATGDRIGIAEGISNGDTIVVSGYHKLSENTLISM
ncbi:MAG: efflux RND transporter periplasmic adaptor subunit, partial [Prevotella sp.]